MNLLVQFDLGDGQHLLAVNFLDGAGRMDLGSRGAEVLVEALADVVLFEVINGGFVTFFHLDDVLAGLGFLHLALAAHAFTFDVLLLLGGEGNGEGEGEGCTENNEFGWKFHGLSL